MACVNYQLTLLALLSSLALLISPSISLTCTNQKLNRLYTNCTDLPYLDSFLHFTYNTTDSTLSIAFVAAPAKPEGWVAWGINPSKPKMIGSQALLAFESNGSLWVHSYNISSYSPPHVSELSYDVWDISAESYDGNYTVIFATFQLPGKTEWLNQVWQVGSALKDGVPQAHDMKPGNLNSTGILKLVASNGSADTSGVTTQENWMMGSIVGLFVSVGSFIAF